MGGLTPLEMGGGIKGIREKGKGKRVPLEMIFYSSSFFMVEK
jgi:hypothetical protein